MEKLLLRGTLGGGFREQLVRSYREAGFGDRLENEEKSCSTQGKQEWAPRLYYNGKEVRAIHAGPNGLKGQRRVPI